jgi:hypothetical protein
MKKGTRVRVLRTNEIGTIVDKQLIRKSGRTRIYYNIRLDKKPNQDTSVFADQLRDTKECVTVTLINERDRKLIMKVTQHYDKSPDEGNVNVVLETEDGSFLMDHKDGFYFDLTVKFMKYLIGKSDE